MISNMAVTFMLLLILGIASAQTPYRVCSSRSKSSLCQALERGSSKVACKEVTDSVDCLINMDENRADFAVITAEEAIMAANNRPDRFHVIASVRNKEKLNQKYAYQSVVLVKSTHTGGLAGLKGGKLCHPGYGKSKEKLWSDRVLKHFEKTVMASTRECKKDSQSSAEDDANDLAKFFTEACRPGPWVMDPIEDKKLKEKFPSLCSLCTSNRDPNCNGYQYFEPRVVPGASVNSHLSAIQCMVSEKGTVAYVAYQHLSEYFKENNTEIIKDYSMLCQNGSTIPLSRANFDGEAPCAWISQPWGVVVARKEKSDELYINLKLWMPTGRSTGTEAWIDSLDAIMFRDEENLDYPISAIPVTTYITEGRPPVVPAYAIEECHKSLKWCTTNGEEQHKCTWVQSAAYTLGLQPGIECVQGISYLDCLSMIEQKRADFVGIDSNYGFLGRKYYNVTAVVYLETSKTMSSKVFALIKESSKNSISRFENLRDKNACFSEYGGITWVAFIRAAHERKVISSNECDYANEVVNFFSASCAPGANDPQHFPSKAVDSSKLCSACSGFSPRNANEQGVVGTFPSPPQVCPADPTNKFYGNKGALICLREPESHVAFTEGQNLHNHAKNISADPNEFRVLCRNNTLAQNPGFDVDDGCALSVTIDSEVVARRGFRDALNLQLLLQDIDASFGYNSGTFKMINMEIFSPFNGTKDLLFKDSTVGLATARSDNQLVLNYIELFKHTESCTGAASSLTIPSIFTMLLITFAILSQKIF